MDLSALPVAGTLVAAGTFERVSEWLTSLPLWLVLFVVVVVSLAEGGALAGLIAPGEVILIVAGFLAGKGAIDLTLLMILATLASAVGDSIGYWLGARYGESVIQSWLGRKVGDANWVRASSFMVRRGPWAVFLGKFVGFLRALLPFSAGLGHMSYGRFIRSNWPACALFAPGSVLLGYHLGPRAERFLSGFSRGATALAIGGFILYKFVSWRREKAVERRIEESLDGSPPEHDLIDEPADPREPPPAGH